MDKSLAITAALFFALVSMAFLIAPFLFPEEELGIGSPPREFEVKPGGVPAGVSIKAREEFQGGMVKYSDAGFTPKSISLPPQNSEGVGCFIKILNEGGDTLVIRLNPHSPKDDRGFLYTPIPPGESLVIDPRYGTMEDLAFHNHEKPEDEFSVTLNSICF